MTPRMTVKDVCALARCERSKVDRATRLFRESKGTKGLRYEQSGPRAQLLFCQRDVEAWLNADPMTDPKRLKVAS
jgi:hypothetical protein